MIFFIVSLLGAPLVHASAVDNLTLPEGASHPQAQSSVRVEPFKASNLSLAPPHRIDSSLPAEKLAKQPLFARKITVNKKVSHLPFVESKLSAKGWELKGNKLKGEIETFEVIQKESVDGASVQTILVQLEWVSSKKAIISFKNKQGENVALKKHLELVKVFKLPVKKQKSQ